MLAKDFMTPNIVTCKQTQTVEEAATLMLEKSFSTLPVVDDNNNLVGIITESDFVGEDANIPHALASIKQLFGQNFHFGDVEPIYLKAKKYQLKTVMTKNPQTITSETTLTDIVGLMNSKNLKRLPVVDNGKVVGMITRKDLIRAFVQNK